MTAQKSGPALPGQEGQVAPHESWTDLERWVWQEIGSGRIADINTKLGKPADPKTPDDWAPERRLSARFLETILLHGPWRNANPRQGVRTKGAHFVDQLDLSQSDFPWQVWLDRSRFELRVVMIGLRGARNLTFDGSAFLDELNLRSVRIEGSLFMRGAQLGEATLYRSRIDGRVILV